MAKTPEYPVQPPPLSDAFMAPKPAAPPPELPEVTEPIAGFLGAVEALLRQPQRVTHQLRQPQAGGLLFRLLAVTLGCSLIYGVVVGTFSGAAQVWAAPLKICAGLLLSALICLPSLYIFSCLSGAPARLGEVTGFLVGLLALMTLLLLGFAPVAWLFSQSVQSVYAMGVLHLLFWTTASYFGLRFFWDCFDWRRVQTAWLRAWVIIFVLVMLQMSTALRPIIGTASTFLPTEKKLFLSHWIETLR